MRIFNTASGKLEEFKSLEEGQIAMYVCGPTVYDIPHLGHGRSAVSFDVMRRYFQYKGFKVNFVSNYTDIDDKMINRAAEEGISVKELTDKIIPEYEKDYGVLSVMKPDVQPKATEYITEMVEIIEKLEAKGYTYVLNDGVYFSVDSFADYGKFSGQNLEELQMGARVAVKEEKRNPADFVLWKFKKEGEPSWESPWGEGRPGWHIECSAMSYKNLGEKFDIHGGGLDLVFPHHECEIAQSHAAFGSGSFAQYWVHNGFINVDNEKMSKSLGNFSTLRDIFGNYKPIVVRFMFLQTHYRNPINFSQVLLDQARAGLDRLHDFVANLRRIEDGDGEISDLLIIAQRDFEAAMDNDFDTSGALGAVFSLVKEVNVKIADGNFSAKAAGEVLTLLEKFDEVLKVVFVEEEVLEDEILVLIKEREEVRKAGNFARSDEIRDELKARGIILEDTPGGTIWKKT